ncbi:MAG: TolC family protein [Spirochaetota bacterium]
MKKVLSVIGVAIVNIFIFYNSSYTQTQFSIQQLIDNALRSFELLKAQQVKIDELEALKKYNTQWKNPEISAYYGNKSIDSQKGHVSGIAVTQPLFFPGKLSLVDEIYRYKKNYEVLSYEEMKYYIATSVINLSYDYAISQLRSSHINSRIKRLNLLNTYMTARPVVSPQKKVEVAIVKNRIRMLQSEIHRIKADQAVTHARLAIYVKLDSPELEININWIENPPVFNVNDVIARAKNESIMVKKQKEILMASLKEISLAKKNIYSDFNILFNYDYEKVYEKEQSISGGISIPIPLYNQNQNAVDALESKAKQEELYLQYIEKMIESDIRTTVAQYNYYLNLLPLFPPSIEGELEQSMYYADDQFQKGTITLQSYLELDVLVHETLENIYTTQKELMRTMATIATLINDYNLLMEIAR